MKRIYTVLFLLTFMVVGYGQSTVKIYIEEGDKCFENGEYECSEIKYNEALKISKGREKRKAKIKLDNAKELLGYYKKAREAEEDKDYKLATSFYQQILKKNKKDKNAATKIKGFEALLPREVELLLTNNALSFNEKGGTSKIGITIKNAEEYSIDNLPNWCTKQVTKKEIIISCKPNTSTTKRSQTIYVKAGDKTKNIEITQNGKVVKPKVTLNVSSEDLRFGYMGLLKRVEIATNQKNIKALSVPSWCTVKVFDDYINVSCSINYEASRKGWFIIQAGDKKKRINVSQKGKNNNSTPTYSYKNKTTKKRKFGFSIGTVQRQHHINFNLRTVAPNDPAFQNKVLENSGMQIGLRYETSNKGFGFGTGLNFNIYGRIADTGDEISLPLHLQYRIYFSNSTSIYAYGGVSANAILYDSVIYSLNSEYGAGIRFGGGVFQINVGRSHNLAWDMTESAGTSSGIEINPKNSIYHNYYVSLSVMF